MTPELYRILHIVGALTLLLGLGGVLASGGKEGQPSPVIFRILTYLALVVMVVAGIGYAHKMNYGWPNWMFAKMGLWLVLGAVPPLVKRGCPRMVAILLVIACGATAVWLAQTKPF